MYTKTFVGLELFISHVAETQQQVTLITWLFMVIFSIMHSLFIPLTKHTKMD